MDNRRKGVLMDRNKITKNDMSLVTKLFKYSTAEKIPFSFMYGERRVNGIPGNLRLL